MSSEHTLHHCSNIRTFLGRCVTWQKGIHSFWLNTEDSGGYELWWRRCGIRIKSEVLMVLDDVCDLSTSYHFSDGRSFRQGDFDKCICWAQWAQFESMFRLWIYYYSRSSIFIMSNYWLTNEFVLVLVLVRRAVIEHFSNYFFYAASSLGYSGYELNNRHRYEREKKINFKILLMGFVRNRLTSFQKQIQFKTTLSTKMTLTHMGSGMAYGGREQFKDIYITVPKFQSSLN